MYRAFRLDANLRRCVRPQRATNIVLSADVDVTPRRTQWHELASGFRTEARKVVRHFFTRLSTALVTLLPSFDSNFSGRLSNPKQCFQVSLSTS